VRRCALPRPCQDHDARDRDPRRTCGNLPSPQVAAGGDNGQGLLSSLLPNDKALQEYARLALPAIQSAGGRYLARGMPARTYEAGLNQRTVLIEFDSVQQAIAAHDSPGYQEALRALGNAAKRDVRIVEGVS
jgi:uncharacterized protein (DUF1330 family)